MSTKGSPIASPSSPLSSSSKSPLSGNGDDGICEELCNDLMTSSYTEISFDHSDDDYDDKTDVEAVDEFVTDGQSPSDKRQLSESKRMSASLSLPQLSSTIVNWSEQTKARYETENLQFPSSMSTDDNQLMKSDDIGTVNYDGPMVSFVTKDFEEKLNMSNSMSSIERDISQNDLKVLRGIESEAKMISQNINAMLNHISESTHTITSLTVECISAYENSLSKTCDVIDANIKSMYQLMAKCEELNQSMKPVNRLSEELKDVKRLLDLFEKAVEYRT